MDEELFRLFMSDQVDSQHEPVAKLVRAHYRSHLAAGETEADARMLTIMFLEAMTRAMLNPNSDAA